ncbi:MAG: hypothetical protein ABI566_05120 [Pseudolysinimonas sp.]
MSTVPTPAPAPGFRGTWVEPTRRLTFSPRFTYEGRYGAAITALVLGGYLLLNANVSQLAIALGGVSSFAPEQTAYFLLQFVFAVAVILFGLAVAPATSGRRVIAVVLVLVLVLVWLVLVVARLTGAGGPMPFVSGFVTPSSFIVPLVTALGWLIVRERPAVSYLFLLLAILGGVVPFALAFNGAPALLSQLVLIPLAGALGVAIAWLARAVAGAIQRSHLSDGYVDPPVAA